jgi:hypothetical protein
LENQLLEVGSEVWMVYGEYPPIKIKRILLLLPPLLTYSESIPDIDSETLIVSIPITRNQHIALIELKIIDHGAKDIPCIQRYRQALIEKSLT